MRIVVDTNTAISGLLWPGPPRRLVDLIRARTHTLCASLALLAEIVEPAPLSEPVSRDPDDDVVLATALAAQALLIVSGDRDLLDLGTFRDIRILNASEALRALGA